jgi:O-antigen/teichoic acid export membrane protein
VSDPVAVALPPVKRHLAYATALGSFVAKGLGSFAITYLLANGLSEHAFGLWATLFSFGTILSVADMGVGQLILTTFHEGRFAKGEDTRLVTNSVFAMALLAVALLAVTSLTVSARHLLEEVRWRNVLIALMLMRLLLIPYGAYLSAIERYHERKLAEALTYAAAAAFIYWGVSAGLGLSALLLGMNAIITLGSFALAVRADRLGMPRIQFDDVVPAQIRRVLVDAFPYFVNNVSGLAIYGGFIAVSSLVLSTTEIARLSLLHNLLLMHLFQVFELIFRSVQPRMKESRLMTQLNLLVVGSAALGMVLAALIGPWIFSVFFNKYAYSSTELVVYAAFAFCEVYYLLVTSAMQMQSALRARLQWMGLVKAVAFLGVLVVARLVSAQPGLLLYTSLLLAYAAVIGLMARRYAHQPGDFTPP